jgi:4-hydroxybenzoate polyprenyltransferase
MAFGSTAAADVTPPPHAHPTPNRMTRTLPRLLPTLQLMRIALVFTAISNAWLVVFLSYGLDTPRIPDIPLDMLLVYTAFTSSGLYVFGMVLNDVLDVRRDKVFAPTRPLASGRMSIAAAIAIAFTALLVAVAASVPLGSVATLITLVTATLILFYNALGKHSPGVGVLTLALIRGGNMLIANPALPFVWPIWWNFTHILTLSAICHALERKRPLFSGRDGWIVTDGFAFVTVVLAGWMNQKHALMLQDRPWIWIGPIVAAIIFMAIGLRTAQKSPDTHTAGGLLMKRGLIYLIVYDLSWLLSAGLMWQAAVTLGLLALAYGSMITMRNLAAALAEPPGYLRDGAAR